MHALLLARLEDIKTEIHPTLVGPTAEPHR
jgi:hypothetical protein